LTTEQAREARTPDSSSGNRAFRGLFLVFALTFLNLAGMALTAIGLNALGEWTVWQFVGLFGVVEAASGLANVVTPNLWAMPVLEQETSARTKTVLALETLTLAHWGGIARCLAGAAMIVAAGQHEGISGQTILVLPLIAVIAWLEVALSALMARGGVAWHRYDVLQVTLNWYREIPVPPISLSASALQFVLSLITIPAISVLNPSVLYQPELAPSVSGLAYLVVFSIVATAVGLVAWYPRIALRAPREQQQEAEARA
jgi:hypothetical protein